MQLADRCCARSAGCCPQWAALISRRWCWFLLLYVINMGIAELLQATGNVLLPGLWMAL